MAVNSALDRYALFMGVPFPAEPKLTITDTSAFEAVARLDGEHGLEIIVSTGVVRHVSDLWHKAMAISETLPEENRFNVGHVDDAIEMSLVWLMLHELNHYSSGHFQIVGSMGISEVDSKSQLELTRRSTREPSPLEKLPTDDAIAIRRYLELQADHDALDIHTINPGISVSNNHQFSHHETFSRLYFESLKLVGFVFTALILADLSNVV